MFYIVHAWEKHDSKFQSNKIIVGCFLHCEVCLWSAIRKQQRSHGYLQLTFEKSISIFLVLLLRLKEWGGGGGVESHSAIFLEDAIGSPCLFNTAVHTRTMRPDTEVEATQSKLCWLQNQGDRCEERRVSTVDIGGCCECSLPWLTWRQAHTSLFSLFAETHYDFSAMVIQWIKAPLH